MKNKLLSLSMVLLLVLPVLLSFPLLAQAEEGGIVPCGGPSDPCTICHLIVGVKRLINWGSSILIALCLLAFTIAGIMYIVSSGNPQMIETAKKFMTSTLSGFAIVLGAWVIVNTSMLILSAKSDLGIERTCAAGEICWTQFDCSTSSSSLGGGGTTPPAGVGCGKIVDAAKAMKSANCYYCNTFMYNPHRSSRTHGDDPGCELNKCSGSPGYTDCQDYVRAAYTQASCTSPSGNATDMYNSGSAIGDPSSLQPGDVIAPNKTHVLICENVGCSKVIHASGYMDGIKESSGSYYYTQPGARVLRASSYCTSCST
jgi:hypothetical protein